MKSPFRLLVLILFFCSRISAQQALPQFSHFGAAEGLGCEIFYGMQQDSLGYLWFGSECGLVRYDGRQFLIYNETQRVPNSIIYDVAVDRNNRIWATSSKGHVFYIENDSVVMPVWADTLSDILTKRNKLINNIGFDKKGDLWIGTTLWMFHVPAAGNYTRLIADTNYRQQPQVILHAGIGHQAVLSQNVLYHNSIQFHPGVFDYTFYINASFPGGKSKYDSIHYNIANTISIPTGESVTASDGRLFFSNSKNLYVLTENGQTDFLEFPSQVVCLYIDKDNFLWVGTKHNGVYRYAGADLKSKPERFLETEGVSGVLIDHENGVWFTTLRNGIFYSPSLFVRNFTNELGDAYSVSGLFEFEGKLFCSTNKPQVFLLNDSAKLRPANTQLENVMVTKLVSDGINLYNAGNPVCRFNKELNIKQPITYRFNVFSAKDIAIDNDGRVLLLTNLSVLYLKGDTAFPLCKAPPGRTSAMLKTPAGQIWIASSAGLFVLDQDSVLPLKTDPFQIADVRHLSIDNYGRIIAETSNEIIYILEKNTWYRIDKNTSEYTGPVNAWKNQKSSCIWRFCSGKIEQVCYWFEGDKMQIRILHTMACENGIRSPGILKIYEKDSMLFLATVRGLSVIYLNQDYFCQTAPPLILNHLEIDGKTFFADSVYELNYDQNSIRFFVDVLNYQTQGKPRYKYKLVGFDSDFLLGTESSVYYSNLAPGEYELILIGVSNNGVESIPLVFHFEIHPPFWKTWWFVILGILFIVAAIYVYVRYRLIKIRKQEEEKANIEAQLASYQMTALRAQMNPHFIFNAINSIQRFVLGNDQQTAYSYLAKFSRLIRQVLNNSKEELISLKEELNTLNLYLEMENLRFDQKFDFETEIDPALSLAETQIPCMLIQPFVENAIWHGIMPLGDSRKGKIKLQFLRKGLSLLISVEDNGVGRTVESSSSKTHKSMGISIARNRLRLYDMRSRESFSFISYTDLKTDDGKPCGTIAKIELANFFNEKKS